MTNGVKCEKELFRDWFLNITGFPRLNWQERLFARLLSGDMTSSLDLPTGLGKTSVMTIWMLARAFNPQLPRRLVYVVDRRVVVDQATKAAENIRIELENNPLLADLRLRLGLVNVSLPVSTLRGKFVDNREWMADPSIPAIIVGTVDMIGSRLLFEGYGVSRGMRRYQAGFLGADTLCVFDEAHLCLPFEALLHEIANNVTFKSLNGDARKIIPPFRYLSLSATGRKRDEKTFALEPEDYSDKVVVDRLTASKNLRIEAIENDLSERLANLAWDMTDTNNRVLVYCDRREDAKNVRKALDGLMKKDQSDFPIEMLVGARRVRERQKLANWLEKNGFLAGSTNKPETPVFLVATSAGEVGIDLDADHMVCDLVAFERMVQRFGRVNRRGDKDSKIVVVALPPIMPTSDRPAKPIIPQKQKAYLKKLAKYQADWHLFRTFQARKRILETLNGDASPGAIVTLKEKAKTSKRVEILLRHAISSEPLRPRLTRALVDAWSMTSLETHTGRPEIEPWLRGWIDKEDQTTIAWRHFLPWRDGEPQPNPSEVGAFFENAPTHLSEALEAPTDEVANMLIKRAKALLNQS